MKIIQINASYKPAYIYGGPTMSVSRLNEELVKAGITSVVYTTTANGETELKINPGIETLVDGVKVTYFRRITKGNSHLSSALLWALWSTLKEKQKFRKSTRGTSSNNIKTSSNPQIGKPSNSSIIVHIHAWWNLVSVGSCLVALLLSRKVILSPRGTLSNYSFGNRTSFLKNVFHQVIGKPLLKRCHFHVSSEKEKQDIFNIINPKSIRVIPNFVSLAADFGPLKKTHIAENAALAKRKHCETECFKILFLSRVEEKKGLDNLFYALQKMDSNFQLTIAGSGNHEYLLFLKSLAGNLGINDRITWIGQLRNEDKFQILSSHDLMVLPSHDESFANVVIESLSVGTAVLVSSKVGLADYVTENDFGWVYPSTREELSAALRAAFQDSNKRRSIKFNAPGKIVSDFNEQKLLTRYLELYHNVLTHV